MPEEISEEKKERKKIVVEEVIKTESPQITESQPMAESQNAETPTPKIAPKEVPAEPPKIEEFPRPRRDFAPVFLWIIIPGVMLLGALLGGIIYYQKRVSTVATATPTPLPVGQPTATPEAKKEVDLTKYAISVLNGSGIKGEAVRVRDLLEKAGFKVSGTGNAGSYDYTKTVVQVRENVEAGFLAKLEEALSKTYLLDKSQKLPDSSKDSVVIIVGSSKK